LHGLDNARHARLIESTIVKKLFPFGNFGVKTLESVILSGRPLNMKAEIDNAFAVIILDSNNLFIDTLTGFSVKYADRKSIFVFFGIKTASFLIWSWGFPTLELRSDSCSAFEENLKEQLSRLFLSR